MSGRFVLPLRPTALIRGRSSFPNLLILGTGDSDDDGTRETEYIDRLDWDNVAGGIADASFASSFPHALGPALPGSNSSVHVDFYLPDDSQLYTTGKDILLVDTTNGWDAVDIDPEPLLRFDEPVTCVNGHDLGGSASELTFMAGSTLALIDANAQVGDLTLHDVQQRVQEMPFAMKDCTYDRESSIAAYLTTDGSSFHAIGLESDGSVVGSQALPGEPAHQVVIDLNLFNFENGTDPDLVLIVADPPTIYLGLDLQVSSDAMQFSTPVVAQPLDFRPTAAVKLNSGADNTDRLYISEAAGAPRCFELGTTATGLAPLLVPCTP